MIAGQVKERKVRFDIGVEPIPGLVVRRVLGEGAFGAVYEVEDKKTGRHMAFKLEANDVPVSQLVWDALVLSQRDRLAPEDRRHFCELVRSAEVVGYGYKYVLMTMVGDSLSTLRRQRSNGAFSIGTSIFLARQTLNALKALHSLGIIHRDVKPGNYAIGLGSTSHTVYILDFGMARKFVDKKRRMRKPRNYIGFRGTVKYASILAHKGQELSRKDDLESWFYMLIEWTSGSLPWSKEEDLQRVGELKIAAKKNDDDANALFLGTPECFRSIRQIVDKTLYYDDPDYSAINGHLRASVTGSQEDAPLDWEISSDKQCSYVDHTSTITMPTVGVGFKRFQEMSAKDMSGP